MIDPDITHKTPTINRHKGIRPTLSALLTSAGPVALLYLALVSIAEIITALVDPRIGLLVHSITLFAMLIHASLLSVRKLQSLIFSLTLAPLIRLVSLALPLANFPLVYWYMIVGIPLFIAAFVAARVVRVNRNKAGVVLGQNWLIQIPIGLAGLGLGYLEYLILRPEPLIPEFSWTKMLLPALVLLVFTGYLEEFIFRGVMQFTAKRSLGWLGVVYISALFAVLHIGYKSILDLVFVFAVALFFSFLVSMTHSLLGVTLAHGLTNIGLFLIFPFIVTSPQPTVHQMDIDPPSVRQNTQSSATANSHSKPAMWAAPPTHTIFPTRTTPLTQTALPITTLTATKNPTETPILMATVCAPPENWVVYTVQPGDSLAKFRQIYGMRKSTLLAANCNPVLVEVSIGQIFYLPYLMPTPVPIKDIPKPTEIHIQHPYERPTSEPPSSRP